MIEMLVTKMRYHAGRDGIIVDIYGRDETGERRRARLMGHEPYFYMREEPKENMLIKRWEKKGKDLMNRELYKIFTRIPADVKNLREILDRYGRYHYEADIPFVDRVRFDCKIKSQIKIPDLQFIEDHHITPVERTIYPEFIYFDIETDDSKGFAHPDYSAHPVRSVAIYSTKHDCYFMIIEGSVDKEKVREDFWKMQDEQGWDRTNIIFKMVENEKWIFRRFRQVIDEIAPDIVTGWNVDFYDIAYMENRAKWNNMSIPDFRRFSSFDLMGGYERLHKGRAFLKLEYVAQKELGVGKLPRDKIHEMFDHNKEKLCVYNLWDVELTRRIDAIRNITGFHLNLSWFAGCDIEKTAFNEPLVDKFILHEIAGIVNVPSKDLLEKTGVEKGAFVDDPVSGKYKYVGMIDFASMYPRNIISTNISSETKVDETFEGEKFTLPSGRMYRKEPKGLLVHIVENLINYRDNIKKEMMTHQKGSKEYSAKWEEQRAVKYLTNAVYGVMGSKIFRMADGDVASDITHMGRVLIQYTIDEVARMGYDPLYADTDSVFFETGKDNIEDAVKVANEVEEKMNKLYPVLARSWNGEKECVHSMKCEKVYKSWIQSGAKKRHIGLVEWDSDTEDKFIGHLPIKERLDIKGFEIVRSNVASITKKVQEDILIMALDSEDYKQEIREYLVDLHDKFYKGEIDYQLTIPASWRKPEYKSTPAHHRALLYSMSEDIVDVNFGDSYCWLYVKKVKGHMLTDVVALEFDSEEVPDKVVIDYDKMWERCIGKPLKLILDSLNMDLETVIAKQQQLSLSNFT